MDYLRTAVSALGDVTCARPQVVSDVASLMHVTTHSYK
jgi:hypothetical protein